MRHALVGQHQGEGIPAGFQLLQQVESFRAGVRAQDAVVLAVAAAQIALDSVQNIALVIDRDNCRCSHPRIL